MNVSRNQEETRRRIEELEKQYEAVIGKWYVRQIGFRKSDEETITELETCIQTRTPQVLKEYEDGLDY